MKTHVTLSLDLAIYVKFQEKFGAGKISKFVDASMLAAIVDEENRAGTTVPSP